MNQAALQYGLVAVAAAFLLLGVAAAWMMRSSSRENRLRARLLKVQQGAGVDQVALPWSTERAVLRSLAGLGRLLTESGLLSGRTAQELDQTLTAAGFRGDRALAVFVGAKVLLLVCLPLIAFLLLQSAGSGQGVVLFGVLSAAICGLLLPDLIIRRLRARTLRELERGLPDGLDLMVICAEAGLALEAAIDRVAMEIAPANRAVATEFAICASELRILPDRRAALMNMAERTQLDLLRRFGMTLGQTLQYGTPLTQALRVLSAEMRHEQLVRFEARAARLPVLLTLPMIVCILPTLFLIVAAPALLQAMRLW